MTSDYCRCGIRYHQITGAVFLCPRCRTLVGRGEKEIVIEGAPAEAIIKAFTDMVEGMVFDSAGSKKCLSLPKEKPLSKHEQIRKRLADAGKKVTECIQCYGPVEEKCSAVCPSCRCIQPCKIGG